MFLLRVPWKLRLTACVVYGVVLTWLLLVPAETVARWYPNFQYADKVLHFLLFGTFIFLVHFAFPDPRHLSVPGWLVVGLGIVYGIGTECLQGLLVRYHRAFEWSDIASNSLGAVIFWWLGTRVLKGEKGKLKKES